MMSRQVDNPSPVPPLPEASGPEMMPFHPDPNRTIRAAERLLAQQGLIEPGDNLVIMSDVRARDALVDCIQLRTVK